MALRQLCYDACNSVLITSRKRSLQRLCFHRCLSVHGGCLPHCMLGCTTSGQTPPWADAPPPQVDPPGQTPPLAQCMLGYTHTLPSACWDTVNKRAVRIPLECILVENNGVTSDWGCNPFSSDSTVFNDTRIASVVSEFFHVRASFHRASLH